MNCLSEVSGKRMSVTFIFSVVTLQMYTPLSAVKFADLMIRREPLPTGGPSLFAKRHDMFAGGGLLSAVHSISTC